MKRYKLLKDTPTIKAGTIFEERISDFDKLKELVRITPIGTKTVPQWTIQDINNFDEWFEEIEEMEWRSKNKYWYIADCGIVVCNAWRNGGVDNDRYEIGNCYRTEEEARYAKGLQIARTKIRRSSDFKPNWNNRNQLKYYVAYDYDNNCLYICACYYMDGGAIVYYKTKEDAEQAIEDLQPEYLLHFGVKE